MSLHRGPEVAPDGYWGRPGFRCRGKGLKQAARKRTDSQSQGACKTQTREFSGRRRFNTMGEWMTATFVIALPGGNEPQFTGH